MTGFIQVFITINDNEKAKEIAGILLEKKLAACVQISGPVTSLYRWKGNLEEDQEWLLTVKSSRALYPELEDLVRQTHPYEVPEILAVTVELGNNDYFDWMEKELG